MTLSELIAAATQLQGVYGDIQVGVMTDDGGVWATIPTCLESRLVLVSGETNQTNEGTATMAILSISDCDERNEVLLDE